MKQMEQFILTLEAILSVFSGSVLNMSVMMLCTAVRSQDDSQQQVNTMHYKILRISKSVEQRLCRATPVHIFHHGNLLPIVEINANSVVFMEAFKYSRLAVCILAVL